MSMSWLSLFVLADLADSSGRIELRPPGFFLDLALDLHADADLRGIAADDVGDEARAFLELDHAADQRIGIAGEFRVMNLREAELFAVERRLDGIPFGRLAFAAHRPRRVTQRAAALAALDQHLAVIDAFPPPGVIVAARRWQAGRRGGRARAVTGCCFLALLGNELEDAEHLTADFL